MPGLFNKAHYEAIALVLRESPTLMEGERRSLTEEFADMLDTDNEQFIYDRFIAAATPDIPVPEEEPFNLMFEVLAAVTDVSPEAKHTINEILYNRGNK